MPCLAEIKRDELKSSRCLNDRSPSVLQKLVALLNENSTQETVSQAFGNWIDDMAGWEWYATLTFRNPNPRPHYTTYTEESGILYDGKTFQMVEYSNWSQVGWIAAHNALRRFNTALVMELDYINPAWVAVMELQKRGVPHWHMLVANVDDQRRMKWLDWWYKYYGIARILPYQQELGARYYLGKYLNKEVAEIQFSPLLKAKLNIDRNHI
jgi:hypothetical protein